MESELKSNPPFSADNRHKLKTCSRNYRKFKGKNTSLKCGKNAHSTKAKYQCPMCLMILPSNQVYARHILSHIGEKPHICRICNKEFKRPDELKGHKKTHIKLKCPSCDKEFGGEISLSLHMKNQHLHYQCSICRKIWRLKCHHDRHMLTHTGEKPYKCTFCNKSFSRLDTLKGHEKNHSKQKPQYNCEICQESFVFKKLLQAHSKIHIQCTLCPETFTGRDDFLQHKKVHKEERRFKCDICSKSFKLNSLLQSHRWVHSADKPFPCSLCTASFAALHQLNSHMLAHTGERPYKCNICNKSFRALSNLTHHRRVHSTTNSVFCIFCDKGFNYRAQMMAHIRCHTGEKPYFCKFCPLSFSESCNFRRHMIRHITKKVYNCPICDRGFTSLDNMKRHLTSSHTKEKPCKCEKCNKLFSDNTLLRIHMKIHGEKTEKCVFCGWSFYYEGNLFQHIKAHIGENVRKTK